MKVLMYECMNVYIVYARWTRRDETRLVR